MQVLNGYVLMITCNRYLEESIDCSHCLEMFRRKVCYVESRNLGNVTRKSHLYNTEIAASAAWRLQHFDWLDLSGFNFKKYGLCISAELSQGHANLQYEGQVVRAVKSSLLGHLAVIS